MFWMFVLCLCVQTAVVLFFSFVCLCVCVCESMCVRARRTMQVRRRIIEKECWKQLKLLYGEKKKQLCNCSSKKSKKNGRTECDLFEQKKTDVSTTTKRKKKQDTGSKKKKERPKEE